MTLSHLLKLSKVFANPTSRRMQHVLAWYVYTRMGNCTWLHVASRDLRSPASGIREGLRKVTVTHSRIHSIRSKGGNIPETVQDKNVVTANQYQEMIFGPSNTATSEDLNWLLRSFTLKLSKVFAKCHISENVASIGLVCLPCHMFTLPGKPFRMRFFSYSGAPVR